MGVLTKLSKDVIAKFEKQLVKHVRTGDTSLPGPHPHSTWGPHNPPPKTGPMPHGPAAVRPTIDPATAPPGVDAKKLNNLLDQQYKGTKMPTLTGDGRTADAVRSELAGNGPTGGRDHTQKARESIKGFENWLRKNPNAPQDWKDTAQAEIDNLRNALNGF